MPRDVISLILILIIMIIVFIIIIAMIILITFLRDYIYVYGRISYYAKAL